MNKAIERIASAHRIEIPVLAWCCEDGESLEDAIARVVEKQCDALRAEIEQLHKRLSDLDRERTVFRDSYLRIRDQRDDIRRHYQHWFDKWQAADSALREISAGNLDDETTEQFAERARRVAMEVRP